MQVYVQRHTVHHTAEASCERNQFSFDCAVGFCIIISRRLEGNIWNDGWGSFLLFECVVGTGSKCVIHCHEQFFGSQCHTVKYSKARSFSDGRQYLRIYSTWCPSFFCRMFELIKVVRKAKESLTHYMCTETRMTSPVLLIEIIFVNNFSTSVNIVNTILWSLTRLGTIASSIYK